MADSSDTESCINEQKYITTFKRENYSFLWRIAQFGECMDRKYVFCSPTYCPSSEQQVSWKMMLFPMDIYPEGKHVALRLIKANDDENYHSVVYTISIIDGSGKYCLMQKRENVFRHCMDLDECSVIDNRKLKENNLFSNGFLTINCKMDVLISDDSDHSSSTTLSQVDIPSVTDMPKYKLPTAVEKRKIMEGAFRNSRANSMNNSSPCSTSQSLEFLSEDYKSLYLNKQECDIIIRVSDGELQAHKAVLIARSDYFRQACVNKTGSFRNPEIYIPDIKRIIMEFVLYYLYTGQLRDITFKMAMEILAACEKLQLPRLEKMIQNFLKTQIDVTNVIDIFKISVDMKMDYLKNCALKFISLNHEEVSKTKKWHEMMQNEPRAGGEVLLTVASFKKNINYNK